MMKAKINCTVTLGRQLGSGGYTVGKMIASALGLAFFDKELLYHAAQESGLCEEVFENADEKTSTGLSRILNVQNPFGLAFFDPMNTPLSRDRIFNIQSEVIRKLAQQQPCLFIGRCADYVLRDVPGLRSLFIHAPLSVRISNIAESKGITHKEAESLIVRGDKNRAAYYNYFTNKEWGRAESYHFSLDSGLLGLERCAEAAVDLIKKSW